LNRDLLDVEERLHEWSAYFKDRARLQKCGSIEGNFKRHASDPDPDGWGQVAAPEIKTPRVRDWVLRAIQTNEAVVKLPPVQRWSITYHYCYPALPRFVVLRAVKRFTKTHITWRVFQDQVEIGRLRVAVLIK